MTLLPSLPPSPLSPRHSSQQLAYQNALQSGTRLPGQRADSLEAREGLRLISSGAATGPRRDRGLRIAEVKMVYLGQALRYLFRRRHRGREIAARLALSLPSITMTLSQHHRPYLASSSRARATWLKILGFLQRELEKPVERVPTIEVGMELEARFKGRMAFFAADVIAVNADGTLDLKYLPSYLQKTAGKNTGRRRAAATEFSSVLDDGEIERGVSADLVRLYPETPRTPREDAPAPREPPPKGAAHLRRAAGGAPAPQAFFSSEATQHEAADPRLIR